VLFDKFASVDLIKKINILTLEMAYPENRHCANCIGTLSFPVVTLPLLGKRSIVTFVSLSTNISPKLRPIFTEFLHVTHGLLGGVAVHYALPVYR